MTDLRWRFPPTARSVPDARRAVAAGLAQWGLQDLTETVTLLVSEVVTNAVLHARTEIAVTMGRADDGVRISVSDGSSLTPSMRRHSATATTGRGVHLLDRLADSWTAEPTDDGKTVSFTVSGGRDPWAAVALVGEADL